MKFLLTTLLILSASFYVCAQNTVKNSKKIIYSNESFYNYASKFVDEVDVKDLRYTEEKFYFRLNYNSQQLIDIWIDTSNQTQGQVVNYMYVKERKKTVFNKINLTKEQAQSAYELIKSSEVLSVPDADSIDNWVKPEFEDLYQSWKYPSLGDCGIEYSDTEVYTAKSYKNLIFQNIKQTAPQKLIDFIENINEVLNLRALNSDFENELPDGYFNFYDLLSYKGYDYFIGYEGSTKLFLGFSYPFLKTDNFYAKAKGRYDFKGNFDISIDVGKANLFYAKYYTNALHFGYRARRLDFLKEDVDFLNYRICLKNDFRSFFSFEIGGDYLHELENDSGKLGVLFGAFKQIKKLGLALFGKSYLYHNQFDYNIGISKYLGRIFTANGIIISLSYEKFYTYEDINFSLLFCL